MPSLSLKEWGCDACLSWLAWFLGWLWFSYSLLLSIKLGSLKKFNCWSSSCPSLLGCSLSLFQGSSQQSLVNLIKMSYFLWNRAYVVVQLVIQLQKIDYKATFLLSMKFELKFKTVVELHRILNKAISTWPTLNGHFCPHPILTQSPSSLFL